MKSPFGKISLLAWVAGLQIVLASLPAVAATTTVNIVNFAFAPDSVTINAGDTVTWVMLDSGTQHNSASDTGVWTGPLLSRGQTFSFKFNSAGTFPYHCVPHSFMQGTVIVNASANAPPTVTITNPPNAATFTAPATVAIQASATDSDGTVSQVEFFVGSTSAGVDTTSPYSVTVSNLAAGSYSLTAKATDNSGATTTSVPVTITVTNPPANIPPSVSITNPANGATFTAPLTGPIEATATDTDGTIAKVEFFANGTPLGTDTTAPYSITVSNVPAGTYTLTANATDNSGATTTSAPLTITVNNPPTNNPPSISITSPTNGAAFSAPLTGPIEATATDPDGTIAKVEFFANGTPLGTDTTAPYSITVSNVPAGTYALTARATDNQGATTTSSAVSITVSEAASIVLSSPERAGAGQFRFTITGIAAGRSYIIQSTTNLVEWAPIRTNLAPGGPVIFTDTEAPNFRLRFYRAQLPP